MRILKDGKLTLTNWIKLPKSLKGETVDMISLNKIHFAELENLAKEK